MKSFERIILILVFAGVLLRAISHNPTVERSGVALIFFGSLALSMLYFYLGFALFNEIRLVRIFKKTAYAHINGPRIFGAVAMGIFLSMIAAGGAFKVMHYTGFVALLTIGAAGVIIVLLVLATSVLLKKMEVDQYYRSMMTHGLVALLVVIFLLFFYRRAIHYSDRELEDLREEQYR